MVPSVHISRTRFAALDVRESSGRPLRFVPGKLLVRISLSSWLTRRFGYFPSNPSKQFAVIGLPVEKYGCSNASFAVILFAGLYSRSRERRSKPSFPGVPAVEDGEYEPFFKQALYHGSKLDSFCIWLVPGPNAKAWSWPYSGIEAKPGQFCFSGIPRISMIFSIWFRWKGTFFLLSIFASSPLNIGRRDSSSANMHPTAQRSTAGV